MPKDLARWGSQTAKGGFKNERRVANEFNNWEISVLAQSWLRIMGYTISDVKQVVAYRPRGTGHKTDVIVRVAKSDKSIHRHKISCKKGHGNQIDKRPVDKYVKAFNLSQATTKALKKFVGEHGYTPIELLRRGEIAQGKYGQLKDERRMIFKELEPSEQKAILREFTEKQDCILKFILQGVDNMAVDWFIRDNDLEPIQTTLERAAIGGVIPTRTGFKIGQIKVQRKGGTPDPRSLQFKW